MTRHVLIVDDDDAIRMVARLGLERVAGWSVDDVADADAAVEAVAADRPDVVLLDVTMPGADGPRILERLRALPAGATVPVLFLTARARRSELDSFQALGVGGVIAKPFDPMTLAGEIARRLGWEHP